MFFQFLICAVAALASYELFRIVRRFHTWYTTPLNELPGPKTSFWIGSFWYIVQKPFMEPMTEWWEAAGKETTDFIHYTQLFGSQAVMVLNAEYIRQMLLANYRTPRYLKKLYILEGMVGKGLVVLEGEDWHRHRRIIHPSFQVGFLRENLDQHVPSRVTKLLQYWNQAGPNRAVEISSHYSMLTLDILGEIAFAHDFCGMRTIQQWAEKSENASETNNIDELPQVSDRLIQSMSSSMKATPTRILLSAAGLSILDRDAVRTRRTMDMAVAEVAANARQRYAERGRTSVTTGKSKYAAKSVLEAMLDAKDTEETDSTRGSLDSKELEAEVKTFLVAGHETTSTWLYWATYCLCQYPEIQERVYQDIIKHAPKRSGEENGDYIDLETVEKMTYLDSFLKEVLRMYPPAGMIIRHNVNDELFGKTTIPASTRLMIPIYLVHRSPRYWKDPETFDPERWLGEEPPYSHSHAYLPFSHGPRNCIGYRFATMEAKLIVASIVRQVRFELIPELRDTKFTLTSYITVKAKPAVKVNVKFRNTKA